MEEEYLDVEQVQQFLNVSKATVWNLLNRYDLNRYHIPARGKKTLVRKSELQQALSQPIPVKKRIVSSGVEPDIKKAAA